MSRRQVLALIVLILLAAFIIPGCAPESTFNRSLKLWQSKAVVDYSYELRVICFCPAEVTSPVLVEIRNGVTSSVRYAADNVPATNEFFERFNTVEKLFAVIRDAYNRKADTVSAAYDLGYGVPISVSIDYIKLAVDEELAFTVRNFTPLTG